MRSFSAGIPNFLLLAAILSTLGGSQATAQTTVSAAPGVRAPNAVMVSRKSFRGLSDGPGIWVNMWNYPQVANVEDYCLKLHSHGIRNVFIQTSRSNTAAICEPEKLGALIEGCHRYKIRVIAWGFHELTNPSADADKIIAVARFRSPNGERIDAVAPNLEKNLQKASVEAYLKKIRTAIGDDFPLIAVVYSPLNKAPAVAHTPWPLLAEYCDVIAPMAYWNSKYQKFSAYDYTLATVRMVRQLTGRPDVEVHVIGDGMGTRSDSINQFLKACRAAEASSASLYPNHQPTDEQMQCMSRYFDHFPVNSRFRLAAYRQLIASGVLENNVDPATPISRGAFYALLLRQMDRHKLIAQRQPGTTKLQQLPPDITPMGAYRILSRIKLVPGRQVQDTSDDALSEHLEHQIWPREGFELVARLVEAKGKLKSLPPNILGHQALSLKTVVPNTRREGEVVSWFGQPAFAEGRKSGGDADRPMSFLDASQLALEAVSGMK